MHDSKHVTFECGQCGEVLNPPISPTGRSLCWPCGKFVRATQHGGIEEHSPPVKPKPLPEVDPLR